jgi:sulfonate dioxygenase
LRQSVRAYYSLSPKFRRRLEGLTAVHSNDDGVAAELKNGKESVMRRDVLKTEHPVVIVHPVTEQKALCEWAALTPTPFVWHWHWG